MASTEMTSLSVSFEVAERIRRRSGGLTVDNYLRKVLGLRQRPIKRGRPVESKKKKSAKKKPARK